MHTLGYLFPYMVSCPVTWRFGHVTLTALHSSFRQWVMAVRSRRVTRGGKSCCKILVISTSIVLRYTIIYSLTLWFDPWLKLSVTFPLETMPSISLESDSVTLSFRVFLIEDTVFIQFCENTSCFLERTREKRTAFLTNGPNGQGGIDVFFF